MDDSPFHAGERDVQARAGVRERAEQLGRKFIRTFMPDQHRQFLEQLPFVVVGSIDSEAKVWASVLSDRPGFLYTPDEHTLRVHALPHPHDPLLLEPGRALGLLGIELPTRRRNRVNGHIASVDARGFTLHVDQSFGNCPMYINARTPRAISLATDELVERVGASLPPHLAAWIHTSDTAFIASAFASESVDASHRGGNPGFVRVQDIAGQSVLTMPDFSGNNAFNTLGNLSLYPRAGLSFPNFTTGAWLALTGRAEIVWEGEELRSFEGAQRLVRFLVDEGRVLPARLPFAWSSAEPAPQLAETGVWEK